MGKPMIIAVAAAVLAVTAGAQDSDNFLKQQAYAEMQRVTAQMDVLQSNVNDLQQRIGRLEGGGDTRALRAEIESLKASVAELRAALREQRGEIVKDLSQRLAKIQTSTETRAPAPAKTVTVIGPHLEYEVQKGDTLSLIAQAFNTSVRKIREMNGLKNDNLQIGQKIKVPKE